MSHKILGNNLVAIRKSKLALKLNKPAYIGMCIVEFSKVSMCEFHDGHIKNKYGNKSKQRVKVYCMKLKLKMYEFFSSNKEMFDFSNYSTKLKYYDDIKQISYCKNER